jgi:hypothetical protein
MKNIASIAIIMKNIASIAIIAGAFCLSACQTSQIQASAAYIASEAATAAIVSKNPQTVPVFQALVHDWNAFQGGKLTAQDEANLLNQVVAATKGSVTPTEAALLDGAVQQILANQNATAPTPLQGAAGAIIQTVVNGIARELVVNVTPAS